MTEKFNLLSDEQLAAISSGKLWSFHGGIHPQENKQQSSLYAIRDAGIPATLIIPVEHKGHTPKLLVSVGDNVLKGQALTQVYGAMVVQHASSSGTVIAIEKRCDLHPSGLGVLSVVIQTDGLDRSVEYVKPQDYQTTLPALLVDKIQQAGIIGLGGAGFPTHLKLVQHESIKLLLINAAECEPYITADDRLMQEQAHEIITGINVLNHILKPALSVIAIEDNKPEAILALQEALQKNSDSDNIQLRIIPTIYPSGSEKQLIEIITGQQTPAGKHPSELGIVMQNVGTVLAIKEAIIDNKPLTSRIVTLTGDSLQKKGNVSARIGTPIQYLLDRYWVDSMSVQQLIIGGPMMGFTITDTSAPVTKTCNCILAPTAKEMPESPAEIPCIRCSECAEACPVSLLPQQLLWYSKSQDHDKLNDYNLSACIECGACAFVCPSHIPLVEYYRVAKAEINVAKNEAKKAEIARLRHENREARLEQAKIDRQAKHKAAADKRKAQLKEKNGGDDLIAAALERAKAKKAAQQPTTETGNKSDAVAAAIARAKAKKAAQAEGQDKTPPTTNKNPAVAAAIARAKAKKAAQAKASENDQVDETQAATSNNIEPKKDPKADPKKAAVAAAIARAKAKKAAQAKADSNSEENETQTELETQSASGNSADPKKAAVAAAIARAKAKKAEKTKALSNSEENQAESHTETSSHETSSHVDPKKAAVAAAIARAKAKKAEKAKADSNSEETETPAELETEQQTDTKTEASSHADSKKAGVAAAIARAKAKKAEKAQLTTAADTAEPDNSAVIAARKLRKEQARLHKQEKIQSQEVSSEQLSSQQVSPQQAPSEVADTEASAADIKKAKIAAAIARAKAKKANLDENKSSEVNNEEQP